jgi:ribosome-associated translation inhibitor RaiA
MPDGQISWIDHSVGQAGIARAGRTYVARLADVEPRARHVGGRVRFAIRRSEGIERAIDVELRVGMRIARHHRQVGALTGSHDPKQKAAAPFSRRHAQYGRHLGLHPLQVVSAWGQAVATGDLDDALTLYSPDARVHLDGVALRSHRQIRGRIESLPVFGSGRYPTVRGADDVVMAGWDAPSVKEAALEIRCQVRHSLITEQWITAPGAELATSAVESAGGPRPVTTTTHGDVPADALDYALSRLGQVTKRISEPILSASVKLSVAPDPARTRPALAQASLNLDGSFVGAHVAAHEMHEAVDIVARRLADQLDHRAKRVKALRRHSPGQAEPGEWHHANLPAIRPEYFDRPPEERQLVRHKAFDADEQTAEEAIFDMDQLDYDFYLFRDLHSGDDSLVERLPGGTFRLQHVRRHTDPERTYEVFKVESDDRPAPTLTVEEAIEQLSAGGARFVFFADSYSRHGCVIYRRYDGHYGLITLE